MQALYTTVHAIVPDPEGLLEALRPILGEVVDDLLLSLVALEPLLRV
jgi:hypothetical protein